MFVLGAPRSGTTLLYRVLRSSPSFAHWRPGEAHEVWEVDCHPSLREWESNALTRDDATDEIAHRIRRSFQLTAGARKRFIDKTPRNVFRVPFVDEVFPDATYVFLQRDGRENINSLINAWRSPRYRVYELPGGHRIPGVDPKWWKFVLYPGWRDDIDGPLEVVCAKQWVLSNEHPLVARSEIPDARWITTRYEDIVEDPVAEIGRLATLLEIPFDGVLRSEAEAISTTPVNTVTPVERGKWRRENPAEIHSILPLIAPTMAKLGYPPEEAT